MVKVASSHNFLCVHYLYGFGVWVAKSLPALSLSLSTNSYRYKQLFTGVIFSTSVSVDLDVLQTIVHWIVQ